MLFDSISSIEDIRKLSLDDTARLAEEIREEIINTVSRNGGHIAPSLGVVELTLALHRVLNTPEDILIWDVGHQTYAHKLITGRRDRFHTVRTLNGISGFPKQSESPFDAYNTGHSSTSLSLALGAAVARDHNNENHRVVAVIGDGSLTGGMAFEALNQIGHMGTDITIILNDNEHSISRNVGGLSEYLTRIISGSFYNKVRSGSVGMMRRIPHIGESIKNFMFRAAARVKGIFIPGQLFEDLGIRYFGPVDGHNQELMEEILHKVVNLENGPKIVHVITKKGKGYLPAELDPSRFHGTGPFDTATGKPLKTKSYLTYSEVAGKTLAGLAKKNHKIVAITAAMGLGTGLHEFEKACPKRFYDVGIAEQHAMTFAGAMSQRGMIPFVSIYSTFMQRAVDQLIHDVAIMNMPIKLLIDRAGIVGDDGETHHGLFDIALLKNVPNFMILAPASGEELRDMIYFALEYNEGPLAIRYPRGSIDEEELDLSVHNTFRPGKLKKVAAGTHGVIITMGDMVQEARSTRTVMAQSGHDVAVINLRTIKPLDMKGIEKAVRERGWFVTLENAVLRGGIGQQIVAELPAELRSRCLMNAGFPDEFIMQGDNRSLLSLYGLDAASLAKKIHHLLDERRK